MIGSLPLVSWYVSALGVAFAVLTATGYAVYTRSGGHHRSVFVGFVAIECCWVLAAIAQLLARSPAGKYTSLLAADVLAVVTIVALGYFATVYTDRSTALSKPRNAALVCWAVVALAGGLTQPLFGLFYESVSYRAGPIPYLATEPGPIYLLSTAVAVGVLAMSIGYLARLFVESAHRSSSSILLLTAAGVLTLLPNIVSSLELVRVLPGYDYTVFGVVPFTFVLGYTVFFRGELDLAPMARNEIVDDIDDVLFGLDDQGRVIDYNAAAGRHLPAEISDPIGTPLSALLPDLADQFELQSETTEEVTATYTTVTEGARTHYAVSVSPLRERGTVAGYTVILRDVTEDETATRELARQNEQLEAFASTVAHDLRNPLHVADGTATLLAEDLRAREGRDQTVDHIERVRDSVTRMDTVLDELQTLAKHAQSVTEMETIEFESMVRSCWERVDTAGLSLTVPADGTIQAEPNRLESIVETLFRHSAAEGGPAVTVELTDTGFVYTDESLQRVDDETATDAEMTADEHLALRLKIVRTQVESQGWTLDVESSDEGTAFRVSGAETGEL